MDGCYGKCNRNVKIPFEQQNTLNFVKTPYIFQDIFLMTDRPSYAIMGNLKKMCGACLDILYTQSFVVQQTSQGERERERETILKPENVNAMQKPNCGTYSSYKMANLDRNGSSFLYLQVYTQCKQVSPKQCWIKPSFLV